MFNNILVTLCCQGPRELVLEQAIVLAKRDGAQLLGLCVVDDDQLAAPAGSEGINPAEWRECLEAELTAAGQALLDEFMGHCAREGVDAQTKLLVGPVTACICRQAQHADLVLTGRYDELIRRRMFVGCSPLEGTVRQAKRPVMVAGTTVRHPRRLLVAYDASPHADAALALAARMAAEWGCSLSLVTVEEKQVGAAAVARAQAYLAERNLSGRCLLLQGNPAQQVVRAAAEQESDTIFIGAYCHGQAQELIFGGAVRQVLNQAECPVVICH
ncbi:MAG: universal stress protein [Chloroflexota bacterium]